METFEHNFIIDYLRGCVYNFVKRGKCYRYICEKCKLYVYKCEKEDFYYYPIMSGRDMIKLNLTCNEYMIKKLLE